MTTSTKTIEVKIERTIPAPPGEVFDAWLDPTIAGTAWHEHDKLIVDPRVDGLWYWLIRGTAHYGRYVDIARPSRVQYSWMSRYTLGEESTVTVTFQKQGEGTLMNLVHSGLPNEEMAAAHDKGWTSISDKFSNIFVGESLRRK